MLVLHIFLTFAVCVHVNLLCFAFLMSVLFPVKLFCVKVYHLIFCSPETKGGVCYPGTVL